MADKKISQLNNVTTPLAGTEVLPVVQGGETRKVTVDNLTAGKAVSAASLTTTGSVGIGVASPAQKLHVASAGANYIVSQNSAGSTSVLLLGAESGKTTLYSWTTPSGATGVPLTFVVGAAENMRLDSAGLLTLQTGDLKFATAGKGIDFSASTNAAGMTSELLNDYEEGTWTPVIIGSTDAGTATYSAQVGSYTKCGRSVFVTCSVSWTGHTGTGDLRITGLPFATASAYQSTVNLGYITDIAFNANATPLIRTSTSSTVLFLAQLASGGASISAIPISSAGNILLSSTYIV